MIYRVTVGTLNYGFLSITKKVEGSEDLYTNNGTQSYTTLIAKEEDDVFDGLKDRLRVIEKFDII